MRVVTDMIMKEINIRDIEGFRIGNATDEAGGTGCTVVVCDEGAVAGVSVMGAAPASRETDLLDPRMMCQAVHGVCLTGGSAYGLAAADGVLKYFEEKGIGFDVGEGVVPVVPTSALFDLICGDFNARPDRETGYAAAQNSETATGALRGNMGAGTGSTVGKYMGIDRAMKSGLGSYALRVGELKIGAVVAVNALGDIFDVDTGEQIAGMLDETGTSFSRTDKAMWSSIQQDRNIFKGNTTIGCVITNADLVKGQCCKLAEMTHDGYARAIKPVHTSADGDTVYFMAKGEVAVYQDALGDLAAYVMAKAINDAAGSACGAYGFKAAPDLK